MHLIMVELMILSVWMSFNVKDSNADAIWTSFATSPSYRDLRMLISQYAVSFPPVYMTKDNYVISVMYCTQLCARNPSCQATNFYEANGSYVCELQGDNYCCNRTTKTLIAFKSSLIWDKVRNTQRSCLEPILQTPGSSTCSIIRPGCIGTWPDCYNCTKTCIDWYQRASCGGTSVCTLWPDGDAPDSVPIFGHCFTTQTFLIRRKIDHIKNIYTSDYKMSLSDMHRLYRLGIYKTLRFIFKHSSGNESYSDYANSYIDVNGTLSNLTYVNTITALTGIPPPNDIFRLNGQALESKPFITVTDDIYNCGSFWLLDPSNATYCPGGEVKILGTGMPKGGTVNLSTLIRYPGAPPSELFTVASVMLVYP